MSSYYYNYIKDGLITINTDKQSIQNIHIKGSHGFTKNFNLTIRGYWRKYLDVTTVDMYCLDIHTEDTDCSVYLKELFPDELFITDKTITIEVSCCEYVTIVTTFSDKIHSMIEPPVYKHVGFANTWKFKLPRKVYTIYTISNITNNISLMNCTKKICELNNVKKNNGKYVSYCDVSNINLTNKNLHFTDNIVYVAIKTTL